MSGRPRILFVEPSPYPSYGGSKRVLVHLAGALSRQRWDPRVMFVRAGPWVADLERQGVAVTVAEELASRAAQTFEPTTDPLAPLRAAGVESTETGELRMSPPRRLIRELRYGAQLLWGDRHASERLERRLEERFDLLHFNDSMHHDFVWYHVARRRRVPYVVHEHRLWRHPPRAWRRVARGAAAVLCLTTERRDKVRAACGDRVRAELLPNGVPAEAFARRRDPDEVRRDLGIAPGEALLITAGHLQAWKGQDLAVDVAADLARAGMRYQWILCGSTVEPHFERSLRERIAAAGLEGRVRILGMRDDLTELYAAADLAVHTSVLPEPFGMTVVEAMAAGTAVVGPAEGGIPDMVRDGIDGRLYTPRDAESLRSAVHAALENLAVLREMGRSARVRAREDFSLDKQVGKLEAIYRRALALDAT